MCVHDGITYDLNGNDNWECNTCISQDSKNKTDEDCMEKIKCPYAIGDGM